MLSNKRHGVYLGSGREGRTSSSGVLKALNCSAPGVPVVGLLQVRRERKRGFQVPGGVADDIVGNWRMSTWCLVSSGLNVSLSVPCGWGVRPPFIDQGGGELHARRAI
jgi:hypothetical protein